MKLILLLLSFFPFHVFAEYRVYEYLVRATNEMVQDKGSYVVTSTLFPSAYLAYHGGSSIRIDLLKSWLCPGHTGDFKKVCSSPYKAMIESSEQNN
ncbi:MAG: hypothetical protein ACO20H_11960 [Bacteriovoracaceae bacterium]